MVRTVGTPAEAARPTVPLALDAGPAKLNAARVTAAFAGAGARSRVATVATGAVHAVFGVTVGPLLPISHLSPNLRTLVFAH